MKNSHIDNVQTELLRTRLNQMNIRWWDFSDLRIPITRTHFIYEGHRVSIIQGFGTYGGPHLLEMRVDSNEPTGFLEVHDCFEILNTLGEENEKVL